MKDYKAIAAMYPITIEPVSADDGGGYVAYSTAFPGMIGDGNTIEEAHEDIQTVLADVILEREAKGKPLPVPMSLNSKLNNYSGNLSLRLGKTLHRALAERANAEDTSINSLAREMIAYGLGKRGGNKSVNINILFRQTLEIEKAVWQKKQIPSSTDLLMEASEYHFREGLL